MTLTDPSIRDVWGGANQSGLRDQNARLVLSIIRRHGEMASAEIARQSGLSAQTVSNIIRSLEAENLLTRGEAVKGKVGKPSVPMALNPLGALSLGLNIGRRSAEVTLLDFKGEQLGVRSTSYAFPLIEDVLGFVKSSSQSLLKSRPGARDLLVGIGISMPNRIWEWLEAVDAPAEAMRAWQSFDVEAAVTEATGLETFLENDATSACISELLLGRGDEFTDFAYIFLGAFVGGGLVLNGNVVSGRSRNGAALGPLPVPDGAGGTTQLLNVSSLYALETELRRTGRDPLELREMGDDWSTIENVIQPWIETTGHYLAIACAALASIVDIEAVMIDGAMPADVCARLTETVRASYSTLDLTGLEDFDIRQGAVGRQARSVGAAILPIHSKYFLSA
ncbi:MAG: ROK family transcriptional regulator [Pseudomonadota bacterium]